MRVQGFRVVLGVSLDFVGLLSKMDLDLRFRV